jgi:hypothetical protein
MAENGTTENGTTMQPGPLHPWRSKQAQRSTYTVLPPSPRSSPGEARNGSRPDGVLIAGLVLRSLAVSSGSNLNDSTNSSSSPHNPNIWPPLGV